jgi:hypothetical protein
METKTTTDFPRAMVQLMEQTIELITIAAGSIAAILAFGSAVYFWKSPEGIARAVAIDKFAEGISMLVILAFAVSYYFDFFVKMPIHYAAALRMFAIVATCFSSIHLAYQTTKIIRKGKNDRTN